MISDCWYLVRGERFMSEKIGWKESEWIQFGRSPHGLTLDDFKMCPDQTDDEIRAKYRNIVTYRIKLDSDSEQAVIGLGSD